MTTTVEISAGIAQERLIRTAIPGPKSQAMHARRAEVVSTGVGAALPVYIAEAHESIVVDIDGNQFIDFASGIGVTTIGHTDDAVVAAVAEQAALFTHTCFTVPPYEGYVRVAELLAQHTPGNHAKRTMLCNSGAEAIENAVKIARKFTGKNAPTAEEYASGKVGWFWVRRKREGGRGGRREGWRPIGEVCRLPCAL